MPARVRSPVAGIPFALGVLRVINHETLRAMQEIDAARSAVEPAVGKLTMAFDSADQVYVRALKHLGYADAGKFRGKGNAAKVAFNLVTRRGYVPPKPQMAADSAAVVAARNERFPNANRLRIVR
jgi:hypothetical protein